MSERSPSASQNNPFDIDPSGPPNEVPRPWEKNWPLNDSGNAERIKAYYRSRICYVRGVGWHAFCGGRWIHSRPTVTRWARLAVDMVRVETMYWLEHWTEQNKARDGNYNALISSLDAHNKWRERSGDHARLCAALNILSTDPDVSLHPDALDDPFILGCRNGYLNLLTGEFRDPHPLEYVTRLAGAAYDPSTQCLRFLARLFEWVPSEQDRATLQTHFGAALCGARRWGRHKIPVLLGPGPGKTLLLRALSSVLGDYAVWMTAAEFLGRGAMPEWVSMLRMMGARMVVLQNEELGHPNHVKWNAVKHVQANENKRRRKVFPKVVRYPYSSAMRQREQEFDERYAVLGCWRGPYGSREAREDNLRFWADTGTKGAEWLVRRLAEETNVDALSGATEALARIGSAAVPAIIDVLESDIYMTRIPDRTEALLRALGRISSSYIIEPRRILRILEQFSELPDEDLREMAYWAGNCLPADILMSYLHRCVAKEGRRRKTR